MHQKVLKNVLLTFKSNKTGSRRTFVKNEYLLIYLVLVS